MQGVLEPYAEISYLEPQQITAASVREADALIVRTRTKCNAELLKNSKVQFIATATIGYDHIDAKFCDENNIKWTNAAGCNAQGVADYVEAAIAELLGDNLSGKTIGVVGVGHVGSLVKTMAERKGMKVILNDPPKHIGVPLIQMAEEADIITFHTPLTKVGDYPTYHLCNEQLLQKCKNNAVIINAARGGVVDEKALLQLLKKPDNKHKVVIDTWENEPVINEDLLRLVNIATYHIAGYTQQGKINATNMCLKALCEHFSLPILSIDKNSLPLPALLPKHWIMDVDKLLRSNPAKFEYLRETYKLR